MNSDELGDVALAVRRRNRIILVGLFAFAVVPLIGAYVLYENARDGDPWATTNQGELLTPIVAIESFGLAPGDSAVSMSGSGIWWIATVTDGGCESPCQHALHQLRQLHVLLGKDADRVKRSLVVLGDGSPSEALVAEYPEVAWFTGSGAALRGGVYIIDPLGNVVLRYAYTDAGKPVLEDIKKLLKVSHIG